MEEFIRMLNSLRNREDLLLEKDPTTSNRYFDTNNKEVGPIYDKAIDLLINDNGSCNWDNIRKLKNSGFRVYAGEQDSFGWLVGCISFKNADDTVCVLAYG